MSFDSQCHSGNSAVFSRAKKCDFKVPTSQFFSKLSVSCFRHFLANFYSDPK